MKRSAQIALAVSMFGVFAVLCHATRMPMHAKVETVIPQASHAFVGKTISVTITNELRRLVLEIEIEPVRTLWGGAQPGHIKARYSEDVPVAPRKGQRVYYADHTGSGIEFQAKVKEPYVCLLESKEHGFALLRLEPPEKADDILQLYRKLNGKPSNKPDP